MKRAITLITNKYILSTLCFIIWICFFDQRDLFNTFDQREKLKDLLSRKHYYEQEIATAKQELADLQSSSTALEKFAREKYLMKKDGEDVYIIEDSTSLKK